MCEVVLTDTTCTAGALGTPGTAQTQQDKGGQILKGEKESQAQARD